MALVFKDDEALLGRWERAARSATKPSISRHLVEVHSRNKSIREHLRHVDSVWAMAGREIEQCGTETMTADEIASRIGHSSRKCMAVPVELQVRYDTFRCWHRQWRHRLLSCWHALGRIQFSLLRQANDRNATVFWYAGVASNTRFT